MIDHPDPVGRIRLQVHDRKTLAAQDGSKIFPVNIPSEFARQETGIKSIRIIIHRCREIISMHDVPVDKNHFPRPCLKLHIRRVKPESTFLNIIQLDPVMPVPGNMVPREQTALIKIT